MGDKTLLVVSLKKDELSEQIMKCPYCHYADTKVLETRGDDVTRRRRECQKCQKRFTTYEQVEVINLLVVKKDHRREQFDRNKLMKGIIAACQKRPVSGEIIEKMALEIETKILNHKKLEVKSTHIGEMVMRRLKKLDKVAYIRFASIYRDFADLESFAEELKELLADKAARKIEVIQQAR